MPNGEIKGNKSAVRISVVLSTAENPLVGPDRAGEPARFWRYVSQNMKNGNGSLDDESFFRLERLAVGAFGRRLRELLLTDYEDGPERHRRGPMKESGFVEVVGQSRSAFAFQVAGFRYGSLALDIDVLGIKALADFFDHNAELCELVLAQYAPLALAYAITSNGYSRVDGLMSEVDASPLGPAFLALASATPVQPSNPAKPSRQTSPGLVRGVAAGLKWQWIAANTSLLVPVLLSLGVLYFGFVGLDRERERVWQAIKDLSEKQNEVLRILNSKSSEPARTDGTAAKTK